MAIEIIPVVPTWENARRVQELVLQDLGRMGMPIDARMKYADPDSDKLVGRQFDRLWDGLAARTYNAAYLEGSIVGIIKQREWTAGDQFLAMHGVKDLLEALILHSKMRQGVPLEGRPLGIHHLSADEDLTTAESDDVLDGLLAAACKAADADDKEIRAWAMGSDPAWNHFMEHGFDETGRQGRPIGKIWQELIVREA